MPKENSSGLRILNYLKPAVNLIPEVQQSVKIVPLRDKVMWTILALMIYLIASKIPLYGIEHVVGDDPMLWTRLIMASNRGTLMELGIGPIVTAGMVVQLLVGAKIISVDQKNKEDKELMNGLQKLMAIVIALFEAFAYVFNGMYGNIEDIGAFKALMIIVQLVFASILVNLLDEVLSKGGYGLVGAISLFIATNVAEEVLWKSFSFMKEGDEYEGAFIGFFDYLVNKPNKFRAVKQAFLRERLPNLNNVIATVAVFMVVNFFQGFQVNIAIHNEGVKGHVESYPIKLFYTSNMPIILQSTLLSNLFFVSRILYQRFGSFFLVRWLGTWKEYTPGGQSYPVGGLVYYINSPDSFASMRADPLHALTYVVFIMVSCAVFSRTWIEVSGSSSRDVANSLKDQRITSKGGSFKSLKRRLDRYIPIAAYLGGVCIGLLSLVADFLGAIGSGTGILLTCGIIYEFYVEFAKEQKQGQTLW